MTPVDPHKPLREDIRPSAFPRSAAVTASAVATSSPSCQRPQRLPRRTASRRAACRELPEGCPEDCYEVARKNGVWNSYTFVCYDGLVSRAPDLHERAHGETNEMPQLQPIDQLVVDIAIDNVTDSYSSKPAHVSPEFTNVIEAGAKELSGVTLCCAQLGLALVLTASVGQHQHTLLFDAGPEGALFLRNCHNLGVGLGDVGAIAVSHGHWDHMGALIEALDHITRHNTGREVPCHVNPGMFLERGAQLTSGQIAPFEPVPSLEALAAHGAQVVNSEEGRLLLEGCFYLSGEIPRVSSFEQGRPDHLCRPSADQPWEPDPLILDERYVAVHVRDKGLIVFSACSHAGIVNVLLHAREVFADVPLYGVLGGLHLSGVAMERLIPDTMAHLKQFGLHQIMPAHCTGWRAVYALLNTFGESVVTPSAVGSRFTF